MATLYPVSGHPKQIAIPTGGLTTKLIHDIIGGSPFYTYQEGKNLIVANLDSSTSGHQIPNPYQAESGLTLDGTFLLFSPNEAHREIFTEIALWTGSIPNNQ